MEEAKKRKIKLKHLEDYANRIELLQDFEFNISSSESRECLKINITLLLLASTLHSVKIFDTSELSMKCERGIDSEVLQF